MVGLITSVSGLLDVQSSIDDQIPEEEEEEEVYYHAAPHQMADYQMRDACLRVALLRRVQAPKSSQLTRRENALIWLREVLRRRLPPLLPSSDWAGRDMHNANPINTAVRQISLQSLRDGIHVLELFAGIGLGVLRAALAASFLIRGYTRTLSAAASPASCS